MASQDNEFHYIHKRTRNPLLVARVSLGLGGRALFAR
jgi:hypothetical protein